MQKIFFFGLIIMAHSASSQLNKKNWLVGGTGNYTSSKQYLPTGVNAVKSISFSILPDCGYFIIDKLAVGINVGVLYSKSFATYNNSTVTTYKIGPFARYYFLPKENKINVFFNSNYNYGSSHFNNFGLKGTSANNSYSFSGGPEFFFNTSVGLELTLGWYHDKFIEDKSYDNSLKVGLGFQIHLQNK